MSRTISFIAFVVALSACGTADAPTALPISDEAGLAKGPGGGGGVALYQVHFVTTSNDGEITTSEGFPPQGISISANNPWKGIVVSGVTLHLNNFTHGQRSEGTCPNYGLYTIEKQWANWDLEQEPTRSYAGDWKGTVTIKSGYLAFDGDRVDGSGNPLPGGVHNVVTQQNAATLTEPETGVFRQVVRDALFKFSGVSTPDGDQRENGSEFACVNYAIELRKKP